VLGGLIGYDRQCRHQSAGLRTHIVVALASCVFMLISIHSAEYQHLTNDGILRADVMRIASGVVMGFGFLGAGTISRSGGKVKGLAPWASLCPATSIARASGAGMYLVAASATGVSLFVLVVLRQLEAPGPPVVGRRVQVVLSDGGASRQDVLSRLGGS